MAHRPLLYMEMVEFWLKLATRGWSFFLILNISECVWHPWLWQDDGEKIRWSFIRIRWPYFLASTMATSFIFLDYSLLRKTFKIISELLQPSSKSYVTKKLQAMKYHWSLKPWATKSLQSINMISLFKGCEGFKIFSRHKL